MSRVSRTVTLELALDLEQIWEVATENDGHPGQQMDVFYVKWHPNTVYVILSGYVISSREPLKYGINWMMNANLRDVPTQVKNQLIAACYPADLAKP